MPKTAKHMYKNTISSIILGVAFGKFSKLLPVKRVKETDLVLAFWHPRPSWEKHIVVVPKKAIKNLSCLSGGDLKYIQDIYRVARDIVKENGWEEGEYTLIVNGGRRQKIGQLHFHLGYGKYTGK
jgi:histidine triad (HIT) family protein